MGFRVWSLWVSWVLGLEFMGLRGLGFRGCFCGAEFQDMLLLGSCNVTVIPTGGSTFSYAATAMCPLHLHQSGLYRIHAHKWELGFQV